MTWQDRLNQIINSWLAAAVPVAQRDPSTAAAATGYGGPEGLAEKLRSYFSIKSQAFNESFTASNLAQATANLNSVFGTQITLGSDGLYYSTPAEAPSVAALPTSIYESEPTVEQVAAFGSGVDFSDVDPTVVEEAAALAPESEAATYLESLTAEPIPDPPAIAPTQPELVAEDAPAPAFQAPAPVSTVPPQTQTVQLPGTFAETTIAAKLAPPQITEEPVMATANIDPSYGSAYSTTLPGMMVSANLGSDLIGGLTTALGTYLAGGSPTDIITGGLTGSGLLPGGQQPPGIAGPTDGGGDKLLQQLLQLLGSIPGGQVPAAVIGGAQSLLGNGAQVTVPTNGGAVTAGMPIAPVMNARQTLTYRAPKGYVVVDLVGSNGQSSKVAMWKPLARSLKLWKARPKPPIKASEWKALKTAGRVRTKAKKIAMESGFSCRLK